MTDTARGDDVQSAAGAADPDGDLVSRARTGDVAAFEQLVVRHQRRAFNVAYRFLGDYDEAQEVTQEAFIQAHRGLGGFRGEARFGNWLMTITLNQCRNRAKLWRRRARSRHDSLSEPLGDEDSDLRRELPDPGPGALASLEQRQLEELVREEMQALDEEYRTVLVLRELQDVAYEDIAQVLGVPVGTVKSRLHRGRAALGERLQRRLGAAAAGGAS